MRAQQLHRKSKQSAQPNSTVGPRTLFTIGERKLNSRSVCILLVVYLHQLVTSKVMLKMVACWRCEVGMTTFTRRVCCKDVFFSVSP